MLKFPYNVKGDTNLNEGLIIFCILPINNRRINWNILLIAEQINFSFLEKMSKKISLYLLDKIKNYHRSLIISEIIFILITLLLISVTIFLWVIEG